MGSKGTQSTTQSTNQSWSPTPQALSAYQNVLSQAQQLGSTPYQAYTGQQVAGFTADQTQAQQQIRDAQGLSQPYMAAAQTAAAAGAMPAYQTVGSYMSPYTQSVVDATRANFAESNAQQQQQVKGNAAMLGALGGDRVGVAQAETARQQSLAQDPVIANLYNQGYQSALGAAQTDAARSLSAAGLYGQLGTTAQTQALTDASALNSSGSQQQQLAQAGLNVPYQQFLEQRAYPYQQLSWLAGIDTGVGSQMGGTSSGTGTSTTTPAQPNPWSSVLGLGLSLGSLPVTGGGSLLGNFLNRSGGGRVPYADGGLAIPYSGGYIPSAGLSAKPFQPPAPMQISAPRGDAGGQQQQQQQGGAGSIVNQALGLAGKIRGAMNQPTNISPTGLSVPFLGNGAYSDAAAVAPALGAGLGSAGYIYAKGGRVAPDRRGLYLPRHFADGGMPSFGEMWSPVDAATQDGTFAGGDAQTVPQAPVAVLDPSQLQGAGLAPASVGAASPLDAIQLQDVPPAAVDAWRRGVDHDVVNGVAGLAPPPVAPAAPAPSNPPSIQALGAPVRPPVFGGDDDSGGLALGYASAPDFSGAAPSAFNPNGGLGAAASPQAQSLLGRVFGLSPEANQALMAAGLGMMASRSPWLGSAIGEGGLTGLTVYAEANKLKEAAARAREQLAERREYHEDTIAQRREAQADRSQYWQDRELERRDALAKTAVPGTGKDADGNTVNGMYQFNPDTRKYEFNPGVEIKPTSGTGRLTGVERVASDLRSANPGMSLEDSLTKANQLILVRKSNPDAIIDKETANMVAEQSLAGNTDAEKGYGRVPENVKMIQQAKKEIAQARGLSGSDLARINAEYQGLKSGQRTLGVQEAKMGSAAFEAEGTIKQARGVIERLPRTSFLPLNQLIQGFQNSTLNPDQAELYGRTQAIVNTYSAVMARGANITTDSARAHASALLNTAGNAETYNRMLDTLLSEIDMAKKSPEQMRSFYRQHFGDSAVGAPPQPGGAGTGAPQPGQPAGALVRQNGHTYQRQSDGSYKAID